MSTHRELLLRYLEGDLSPSETEALETRLASDIDLRDQLKQIEAVRSELVGTRAEGFSPFFVDRTMRALAAGGREATTTLYDGLRWVFTRVAGPGFALAIALAILNVFDYQDIDFATSWIDAAFGLPSATVEDAFSYGVM